MTSLESRYRKLMVAYPPEYRAARQDEMIAILLDRAGHNRSSPTIGEAWDLVSSGIAVRAASSGRESRRAGRAYASLIACALTSMLSALVVSLWVSGFYPSASDVELAALWSPFALLVSWYVAGLRSVRTRLRWILIACCLASVIAGAEHTMAQRSLVASLTLLGIVMVTAPTPSASRGPRLVSRLAAMVAGVGAGVAMAVRLNLEFDRLEGAHTLRYALPHPPPALVPLIIAASIGLVVASLFRPALAIAVGIVIVPVGVIRVMLTDDAFFFTLNAKQIFQALLAGAAAGGLIVHGTITSMRTRRSSWN